MKSAAISGSFGLAPASVLRAAHWPLHSVLALTESAVALADHETRLIAELQILWTHTLRCPRFRRALAASHPELYVRLKQARAPQCWNKRARQLADTLYHYWARASWRTEPNALWAGVQLLDWEQEPPQEAPRWHVAPQLEPWRELFGQLMQQAPYAQCGHYKTHPGLSQLEPGTWIVQLSTQRRRIRLGACEVARADRALENLIAGGACTWAECVARVRDALESEVAARAFVDTMVRARVLIGGLGFPGRFETAIEALELAGASLLGAHQARWRHACAQVACLCQSLQARADAGADDIVAAMNATARVLTTLAAELNLAPPRMPRALLHIDSGLPAPAPKLSAARAQALVAAGESMRRQMEAPTPPFGLIFVRANDEQALWQGMSHEPWLAYARFGGLLGKASTGETVHQHALHRWCASELNTFAATYGVRLACLIAPCGEQANLWAQPRFAGLRTIDPYGSDPDQWVCRHLTVQQSQTRYWITSADDTRPLIALCASALDVGRCDPVFERLLLSSWRFRAPTKEAALSAAITHAAPSSGAVQAQRARWDLSAAQCAALTQGSDAERFSAWQQCAQHYAWPALLVFKRAGVAAVLLPRDSALAVALLLRRLRGGESLTIEAVCAADLGLLEDERGNRYASEWAIAFTRQQHDWQSSAVDANQPHLNATESGCALA